MGVGNSKSITLPVPLSEERQVEVSLVMVDGAAAAVPPDHGDPGTLQVRQVGLHVRVLVTADHDARGVPPQEEYLAPVESPVPVQPVLEGEIGIHVGGLGDEHDPLDRLLGGVRGGPFRSPGWAYTSTNRARPTQLCCPLEGPQQRASWAIPTLLSKLGNISQ